MIIVMKINFDIDISNEKEPQSPILIKQESDYISTSLSIISHLFLLALLFSPMILAKNVVVNEGDNSIKAIMIDVTQIAAPEQSLVENAPDIKGVKESDIIENNPIDEPIVEPVTETQIIPEKKPEIIPENKLVIEQKQKPKPKPKPKTKQKPIQKESRQQVRQEVISDNFAKTAVASSISDSHQYSGNPSPISRNQPEYPRRALDMRLEGHVVALFDINSNGRVENIRIIETKPNNIFNRSVITAMKTWKYERKIAKDLKIKIIFNRDKSISLDN